jgi:peptide/nickel transport system permease protein
MEETINVQQPRSELPSAGVTAPGELGSVVNERPWGRSLGRVWRNRGAMVGISLLLFVVLVSVIGSIVSPYTPTQQILAEAFEPPSAKHWFGTDDIGRDVFTRVAAGAFISLQVAVLVLGVSTLLGGTLGAFAGYYGGVLDEGIMRIADIFFAFPHFLLAMAIVAALGPGLQNAMLAVAIAYWPRYARLLRGSILSTKNNVYVEAATSIGVSDRRIIARHILPNAVTPLSVQATMDAGIAILTTAALSFVGLGAQPPTPEWGAMVASGRGFITTAWWIPTFPGLFIAITVGGFMFLGDGLRDLLDPTLRGRVEF